MTFLNEKVEHALLYHFLNDEMAIEISRHYCLEISRE